MNIQMTITVTPEQAAKIADILSDKNTSAEKAIPQSQNAAPKTNPVQSAYSIPNVQPAVPVNPAPVSSVPNTAVPVNQAAPVNTTAIQSAPIAVPCTYTIEQIQAACAPLMDAGKQQELVNLLAQFGVPSLPQLPFEQYGAFVTALRGLGAKI